MILQIVGAFKVVPSQFDSPEEGAIELVSLRHAFAWGSALDVVRSSARLAQSDLIFAASVQVPSVTIVRPTAFGSLKSN
jgi:hypothetical protein